MNMLTSILAFIIAPALVAMAILAAAEICRALFGRSPRQPKFKYRIDTLRR